ncbi:TonB family protein [Arenimonas donghaensis]|uniref:TonB C-terminal domain-containing protein n=1 Tax=Arenimonas donghaensis DSM 18148 = HO3-R19 TaxID=1121014 RepID=A0A087MF84_9GAMM|nr:TonB family protein [Arenimonas donghaensis]KFL35537.1 hypothetical protein N788_08665 [Arenimonas donghaensis DSM 18148 = HO3-R19]
MLEALWTMAQLLTLVSSLAIVLVLLARPLLQRSFGSELAYMAWAAVPLALLAVLVPQAPSPVPHPVVSGWTAQTMSAVQASIQQAPTDPRPWLLAIWCLGALAMLVSMARTQRRFARQVARQPGQAFDCCEQASPAVFGLWRPRIVLPVDFATRYDVHEQALLLAHEHEHLRRNDIPAQALASVLRCVFWFNPLMHLAARRFRLDQELACDAAVLRRHPRERRRYGEAMLKTQLAALSLPLGCHWPSCHPLKERITMLKQSAPGPARRRFGSSVIAAGLAVLALGAWAAQPSEAAKAGMKPLQALTDDDVIVQPKYPAAAVKEGIGGLVVLDLLIGDDGIPTDIRVHRADPEGVFEKQAVEAAREWRFNAGREGRRGDKVEGWIRVPVKFTPPATTPPSASPSPAESEA